MQRSIQILLLLVAFMALSAKEVEAEGQASTQVKTIEQEYDECPMFAEGDRGHKKFPMKKDCFMNKKMLLKALAKAKAKQGKSLALLKKILHKIKKLKKSSMYTKKIMMKYIRAYRKAIKNYYKYKKQIQILLALLKKIKMQSIIFTKEFLKRIKRDLLKKIKFQKKLLKKLLFAAKKLKNELKKFKKFKKLVKIYFKLLKEVAAMKGKIAATYAVLKVFSGKKFKPKKHEKPCKISL